VGFSPVRPLVFATTSIDGFLYLFDLGTSAAAPIVTLEVPDHVDSSTTMNTSARDRAQKRRIGKRPGLVSVAFNRKQRDLVAACDTAGHVHIWRLSWSLCNKQASEEALLDDFIGVKVVDKQNLSSK